MKKIKIILWVVKDITTKKAHPKIRVRFIIIGIYYLKDYSWCAFLAFLLCISYANGDAINNEE